MNWYKKAKRKIEFSDNDLQVIKELLEEGYSYNQISNLTNVSDKVIKRLNKEYKWINKPEKKDRSGE